MADPRATFSFSGDPSGSLFDPPDYFSGQFNSYKSDPRSEGRYKRVSESGIGARQEDQRKVDDRMSRRGGIAGPAAQGSFLPTAFNPYVNEEYDSILNHPGMKSKGEPQKSKYWDLLQRLLGGDY